MKEQAFTISFIKIKIFVIVFMINGLFVAI